MIGFYEAGGSVLESLLTLGPDDMEPWIARIENYIAPDFMIGERVGTKLDMEDLHVICGEKDVYFLDDAKALYKRQWNEARYAAEMDLHGGYSSTRMLEILRLRARYLIDRGSTLNNPHIPRRFFAKYANRRVEATVGRERLRRRTRNRVREVAMANGDLRRIAAVLAGKVR